MDTDQMRKSAVTGREEYDVIVCGGGPAGFGAAMAAGRAGAKVLLLEARSFLGGVASTSLFMPVNRLKLNGGTRGGVHQQLVEALEALGPDASREGKVTWTDGDGLHIHPDYLKLTMFRLLEKNGCAYRLYSPVCGAVTEDADGFTKITAVQVLTKSGVQEIRGKIFIDCTGDGDLAFFAGAETETGDPESGALMPVTLGFSLANVDTDALFAFYNGPDVSRIMKDFIGKAEEKGLTVAPWYSFDRTTVPGVVSVNNGGVKNIGPLNTLLPETATLAERLGVELAVDFVNFAREYGLPGLENCSLDRTGAAVGVRETRRIKCDYVLTMEDAENGTEFPDVIARRYGAVDQAGSGNEGERPKMKSGYGYPYRALCVSGFQNLLAAGRCGSYTHTALAAGKSMGNMMAIGQAAGLGAALASEKNTSPRAVPASQIQEILRSWSVTL